MACSFVDKVDLSSRGSLKGVDREFKNQYWSYLSKKLKQKLRQDIKLLDA
jgi:hypothetical protein